MQGLVIENKSNIYLVKEAKTNNIYSCYARGKFKKKDISPVVGDRVDFTVTEESQKEAIIDKIHARSVNISRPKMSNITKLIFVISSKDPKPDLLMLDKQLAFASYLNVEAIIVLNKTDLDKKHEFEHIKSVYENIGYTVILTNAKTGVGVEILKCNLDGEISAFAGNSGVGKSTLINAIFGEDTTLEGEVSSRNKRGKNTTTSTRLYELNNNTYIADTPGFSTFDIKDIESKDLYKYFIEFNKYIEDCEFIGCTHVKEENCGVKRAVNANKIDSNRYERFCKIYQELKEREERRW